MALHPKCAINLSVDLIGDARNAQLLLDGKPLTTGVDKSLIAQGEA